MRMKRQDEKKVKPRERRYFSESFRKARVKEYEEGEASVSEISRTYGMSKGAVYKWIEKYSLHYEKSIVKVIEPKSETRKRIALEKKVKNLEQLIGQQQVELAFLEKLIELADERYGIELKKNLKKKW
jgi:transposase